MKKDFTLMVNGKQQSVSAYPDTPLLYILRNDLNLNGPKFGCGLAQCGSCTILLNGSPVPSCQMKIGSAEGMEITTLEGLSKEGKLHKVQQAFIDEQAAQCGYCLNGMVMQGVALLQQNANPTDDDIKLQLNGNICRCGVHSRIIKAIKKAAKA